MYDNIYFYCYQILRILKGNEFLYEWKRDRRKEKNYLLEIKKYSENLYSCIYKIAIVLYKEKKKIGKAKQAFEKELARMENKSEYLKEIYTEKRRLNNSIKKYDKIINDKELLLEEFNKRNDILTEEKKIFSLSDLVDLLQKERADLILNLQEVTALGDPKNYIEKARRLKDKIDLISQAEVSNLENLKEELNEIFVACLEYELEKRETKKELLELLYHYRYACYLNGKKESLELGAIISKTCKLKVLAILHEDIEYNKNIIEKILSHSIIELENINLILNKNENLEIEIYDKETFDRKENLELKSNGFTVKFGKKIKLVE